MVASSLKHADLPISSPTPRYIRADKLDLPGRNEIRKHYVMQDAFVSNQDPYDVATKKSLGSRAWIGKNWRNLGNLVPQSSGVGSHRILGIYFLEFSASQHAYMLKGRKVTL